MASKKVTLAADGLTATVADATVGDVFTTLFSTDSAVTGLYGLGQRALCVVGGMSFQSKRMGGSFNPFG
jgi:hypothetical protein